MNNHPPNQVFGPAVNRIADMMAHCTRFQFRGTAQLAYDAGVFPSSVTRLIHGQINPSFLLVARITSALERQLGFNIDPRDLVGESGQFLTKFLCEAVGCPGCLPENATGPTQELNPLFDGIRQGEWVTSKYPRGFKNVNEAR